MMNELFESLILDCDNLVREIVNGRYVSWCNTVVGMVRKLAVLKQNYEKELKSRDESINNLKNMLKNLGVEFIETTDEKLADQLTTGGKQDGK